MNTKGSVKQTVKEMSFDEKVRRHDFNKMVNSDPQVQMMNKYNTDTTPGCKSPARRKWLMEKIMEGRDGQDIQTKD